MKRFFYLFASAALLLSACEKSEEAGSITVSATTLSFGSAADSKEFTLTANKSWTVQNSNDWITITPAGGNSATEQTVTIAVSENNDVTRSGEVTFNVGNDASATVKVSQEGTVIEYAGEKYKTVKMKDGRVWMAENLRYVPTGKTPSSDPADGNGIWNPVGDDGKPTSDAAVIADKGYLYDYPTVLNAEVTKDNFKSFEGTQGICPDGWHIPTRAELVALCGYSNKGVGEDGPLVDKNAAYYDEVYNGAKITTLDADGFDWAFSGIVNRTSPTASGKYTTLMTSASTCSVEAYVGKPAMSYLIGSTAYTVNENTGNIQFFGIMSTFTKNYPEGRLTVGFTNNLGGQSLRCVKNQE